jgi:hypothetical protein
LADRVARAVLLAIGLALAITVVTAQQGGGTVSGRLGGDFPAFYGAARIVSDGDIADLYDVEAQTEAQADLWGPDDPGVLYFAYPPHVAAAYGPLASLSYPVAYALHTLLMSALVLAALALAKPLLPGLATRWWVTIAAVASFYPMFRAVTAGQNTALTLFLIVAAWRLVDADRDVAAGLVLALLLYKPQYAIPLIGLLFLSRRWRVVVGAAIGAGGLWALGAIWLEPNWLASWWNRVVPFAQLDAQVNAKNSISAPGFAEALGGGAWSILGWTIAVVVGLTVSWVWWRRVDQPLTVRMAVAAPAILLMSPHSMFYDASLILISVGVLVAVGPIQRVRAGTLVWVLGFSQLAAGSLGWSPLFFVVAGVWLWALWTLVLARPLLTGAPQRPLAEIDAAGGVLTVVVPAHNEEQRIGATLESMAGYLADTDRVAEVIVVDDGSTDRTVEVVASYGPSFEALRILRLHENHGKGAAVRAGMLTGSGDLRLFMDADNATALDQLDRLLADASLDAATASVAVGSIAAGETDVREQQPVLRRVLGRMGNLATQAVAVPGVRDTQRGFKLFTADAAEVAFGPMHSTRWVFDVEALARARRAGHRILEVPITWRHIDGGEIRAGSYVSSLRELGRIVVRLTLERVGSTPAVVEPIDAEPVTVSPPSAGPWPEMVDGPTEVAPEPG